MYLEYYVLEQYLIICCHFQGHFEILSLSGLFLLTENGQRTGGLSVSLAGPDGRVFGGRIAGPLRAASPIQVVGFAGS